MKPVAFDYARPATSEEAVRLLRGAGPDARPVAGSQSLGPMLNLRLVRPSLLVDLRQCSDLRSVTDEGDALVYGAAITHAEIEDGRVPDATGGWMAAAARHIAYRAVRTRGTLGGSLAHADPAADWVTVMSGLGAELVLRGPDGLRALAMTDFMLGPFATAAAPGEILVGVRVKKRNASARWGYWKYCRKTGEFAKAAAAVLVDPDHGETRVVAGALERAPLVAADPQALIDRPDTAASWLAEALSDRAPATLKLHATAVVRAIGALSPQREAA